MTDDQIEKGWDQLIDLMWVLGMLKINSGMSTWYDLTGYDNSDD